MEFIAHPWTKPHVALVRDVLVGKYGAIMNGAGHVVPRLNPTFDYWYYSRNEGWRQDRYLESDWYVQRIQQVPVIDLAAGRYVHALHYFNHYVYGHIYDTLQSLQLVEQYGIDGQLLVNPTSDAVDWDTHLSLFGFSQGKRLSLDVENNVYRVPELVVPSLQAEPGRFRPDLKHWLLDRYWNNPAWKMDTVHRKLYLSRKNGNGRCVINEPEILEMVQELGFSVVYGDEPLGEQVRHFSSAVLIVGYHGSLFKNLIFCRSRPRIVEFCPATRPDRSFVENAKAFDVTEDYRQVLVEANYRYDGHIDPAILRLHVSGYC